MRRKRSLAQKILIFFILLIVVEGAIYFIDILRTPQYESSAKYMIVLTPSKDNEGTSMNAYNSSVAANHLAQLTAEMVETASFIKQVYKRSGIIYNSEDINKYKELINAKVVKETEIVEVTAINQVPKRSRRVSQAIIDTLKEEIRDTSWTHREFEIEVIDQPSTPQKPISPKPMRDVAIGFVGFLMITGFYYLLSED